MKIQQELFELQDQEYGRFQSNLVPTVPEESIIGVRTPVLRNLAKSYRKDPEYETFLHTLPHDFYDENMLHGILLSEMKDYASCMDAVEQFLPYVDNWAVCDTMAPKVFKNHKSELLEHIRKWTASGQEYTCRFGLKMLMTHFLDEDFQPEYLDIAAGIHREEYYVKMMVAWFFATALAKQWESTIPYITEYRLEPWVHNKTIQKARESYRITKEQKEYLKYFRKK